MRLRSVVLMDGTINLRHTWCGRADAYPPPLLLRPFDIRKPVAMNISLLCVVHLILLAQNDASLPRLTSHKHNRIVILDYPFCALNIQSPALMSQHKPAPSTLVPSTSHLFRLYITYLSEYTSCAAVCSPSLRSSHSMRPASRFLWRTLTLFCRECWVMCVAAAYQSSLTLSSRLDLSHLAPIIWSIRLFRIGIAHKVSTSALTV